MPFALVERDPRGDNALREQSGRHLTGGVDHPGNSEITRRLHQVVSAEHVVVEDIDLGLTTGGRIRGQVTDAVGPELEERVIDLARVRQIDPAEVAWKLQLRSTHHIEIHHLMASLRQVADDPASGPSRSSGHNDSHLENSFIDCSLAAGYARQRAKRASQVWQGDWRMSKPHLRRRLA